jgi:hypothetical protein
MEVVDERHCAARHQRETEHDVEPEHMEQRQHRERDVTHADAQSRVRLHLFEICAQGTVREHRRLRRARSSRGEEQHREIVGGALDGCHRLAGKIRHVAGVVHEQRNGGLALSARASREVGIRGRRHDERGRDHPELARELE